MTKKELFKDLWNSYSKSCDTPYRQWVKQGFDWMFGWHEAEVRNLDSYHVSEENRVREGYGKRISEFDQAITEALGALNYYSKLEKCKGLECCGNCGDTIIADDAIETIKDILK